MTRSVLLVCSVLALLLYVASNILGPVKWEGYSGIPATVMAALGLVITRSRIVLKS